jgi:phage/plasmid-like protein (TIGR03299 family)
MASNIFNNRFYSLRAPAWHNLGIVSDVELTATEAYNATQPLTIVLQDVFTQLPSLTDPEHRVSRHSLNSRAIVRYPTPDDPEYRTFGIVSNEYTLVDPLTFCESFDEAVCRPVETIGTLGKGETLFISTKLPTFEVKGDEVENYLLTVSPYTAGRAVEARITPVRVVCQNTLITARAASVDTFTIRHDKNVLDRTKQWLAIMSGNVQKRSAALALEFDQLASVRVPTEYLDQLLGRIYPDPKPFRQVPDEAVQAQRKSWHDENMVAVSRARSAVKEVFEGRGVGMDTLACAGTAWGLFNSTVEYEQFRPNRNAQTSSSDMLFGSRRDICERSYSVLIDFVKRGGTL